MWISPPKVLVITVLAHNVLSGICSYEDSFSGERGSTYVLRITVTCHLVRQLLVQLIIVC